MAVTALFWMIPGPISCHIWQRIVKKHPCSCTEAVTLCDKGEKNAAQRKTKVSFGRFNSIIATGLISLLSNVASSRDVPFCSSNAYTCLKASVT